MDISDLKPAPYNPRVMKDKAKKGLRRSLKEFGDLSGITFNKTTGNLVTGHHRLAELKELHGDGLILVQVGNSEMYHLLAPNDDQFPVRVVEWPVEKEMAANVTANNIGIQGRFTDELQPLLWKIKDSLNATFSELNMDSMVKYVKSKSQNGTQEFSEYIDEANNYVVLVFRSSIDWLSALTHFKLESKVSKRANGKPWSIGIGRCLDGSKYLKDLKDGKL